MATIPTTSTYAAGARWRASDVNTLTNSDKSFFLNPPMCSLYALTATTLTAAGTWYSVAFDGEDSDLDGMHSTTTNTSRITAVTAGWYLVTGTAMLSAISTAVSYLHVAIVRNGVNNFYAGNFSSVWIPGTGGPSTNYGATHTRLVQLNAGQYVELQLRCGTAGATTSTSAGTRSTLEARWIGTY